MKLAFEEATQWATVPVGYYAGEIEKITEREAPADKFHTAAYTKMEIVWVLKDASGAVLVDEATDTPIQVRSWINVPKTFNPKSHMFALADALGLVKDEQLLVDDTDAWIGKSCNLNVLEEVTGEGEAAKVRNRVDGYSKLVARPARGANRVVAAKKEPVVAAVAFAPEDDEDTPF